MEVTATAKQVRLSPRKVRLVLDTIRGKKVDEALNLLDFIPNPSAHIVSKLVRSAAANAENNFQMLPSQLRIIKVYANESVRLKRIRAGSRGRVNPYRHRFCHITVIVEEE